MKSYMKAFIQLDRCIIIILLIHWPPVVCVSPRAESRRPRAAFPGAVLSEMLNLCHEWSSCYSSEFRETWPRAECETSRRSSSTSRTSRVTSGTLTVSTVSQCSSSFSHESHSQLSTLTRQSARPRPPEPPVTLSAKNPRVTAASATTIRTTLQLYVVLQREGEIISDFYRAVCQVWGSANTQQKQKLQKKIRYLSTKCVGDEIWKVVNVRDCITEEKWVRKYVLFELAVFLEEKSRYESSYGNSLQLMVVGGGR